MWRLPCPRALSEEVSPDVREETDRLPTLDKSSANYETQNHKHKQTNEKLITTSHIALVDCLTAEILLEQIQLSAQFVNLLC